MGGAPKVQAPQAPNTAQEYQSALQAYTKNAPQLYQEEAQYQPLYNQMNLAMNQANIGAYTTQYEQLLPGMTASMNPVDVNQLSMMQQLGPLATQAMMGSNPAFQALYAQAGKGLGATADPTLQGMLGQVQAAIPGQQQAYSDLAAQTGRDVTGVNTQLQDLYGKVGADVTAADLTNLRNRVAADPRSAIFQQTSGQIMGGLGQVDPLTQQLKDVASQQLALGGNISPQEAQDVAQQARAAYSARGMLNQSGAIAAEVLNRSQYQQQRLQQREQFGMGVSQIADQQAQERIANAFGLTQADIGATQANMQLAGQMTQGISGIQQANIGLQSGLQGQIAANLAQARQQQAALQQASTGAFQTGMQQAAGLQGSILDELYRQQQAGTSGMQYLAGSSQQALASLLGASGQAPNYASIGAQMNAYGTGGPDLFQSSGILALENQNQMARMNAQGGASIANAQAKAAAQGGMVSAGGAIAGAAITGIGAVLL